MTDDWKAHATDLQKIRHFNGEITKNQAKLSKLEDYSKVIQSLVPMVELAYKMSVKTDIDTGEGKKTWRMVLADILTIKEEVAEAYSGLADLSQDYLNEINKLKGGANANL